MGHVVGGSGHDQTAPSDRAPLPKVCAAAAGGLDRDELHNEVLHKGGGGAPVPATAPLLGGSQEKESGGAASGDDLSELPRGTGRGSRRPGAWDGWGRIEAGAPMGSG